MKGIIIWEDNERATYCELINNASPELTQYAPKSIICSLKGEVLESSKAACSKDDTYDFETGALISLMKMCGLEKSAKAYAEIFDDTAYGDALIERDKLREENKRLKASICSKRVLNAKLLKEYSSAQSSYEIMVEKSADLMDKVKELEESNKSLCEEIERLRDYNKSLEDSRDRLLIESRNRLKDKIDLKEKYVALAAENEKLNNEVNLIKDALNAWKERYRDLNTANGDLVCENYKLKNDCEKLQHGYIDTDMVFCGGRQNGKQFTFLVELFKKLPQDKVEAAYKKVYHTTLPAWQKEVLNQIYGFHKESKEKPELPRTLDINGTTYRKTVQIKDFSNDQLDSLIEGSRAFTRKFDNEWLYKKSTKREKMWEDIKNGKIDSVKVEKAFINDFLSEAEENGLVWANGGEKPTEWNKWESWRRRDYIVFSLLSVVNPKELTWNITLKENTIDYLPPMRWDLFEKGRLAVKVVYDNYKEFYEACEKELGKKPSAMYTGDFTVSICKKDGLFEIFTIEDQKKTGRKIVDWEDVR